ncbi:hypothetical protein [Embleya hyalina]|uniref:hypothetical protein n=1 Tax=Embleya hyalina TaxID=516124 RepID=UPI001FE48E1F|nr:hypothetical protein [Embleya hyalina]
MGEIGGGDREFLDPRVPARDREVDHLHVAAVGKHVALGQVRVDQRVREGTVVDRREHGGGPAGKGAMFVGQVRLGGGRRGADVGDRPRIGDGIHPGVESVDQGGLCDQVARFGRGGRAGGAVVVAGVDTFEDEARGAAGRVVEHVAVDVGVQPRVTHPGCDGVGDQAGGPSGRVAIAPRREDLDDHAAVLGAGVDVAVLETGRDRRP